MTETDTEFVERMTSRWHSKKNKPIGDIDMAHLLDLARRGAAVQWRPISEAPGGTMSLYWSMWAENGEPGCQLRYYPGVRTTHWMPLPPPPTGEPRDE